MLKVEERKSEGGRNVKREEEEREGGMLRVKKKR